MCLHDVTNKKETLETCETGSLEQKPCLIGYKFVVKDLKDKSQHISPAVFCHDNVLHEKWNAKDAADQNKRLPLSRYLPNKENSPMNSKNSYPIGCHVFLNKGDATTCSLEYFAQPYNDKLYFLIPVYFYKKHVLATGTQKIQNCVNGITGSLETSSAVVSQYYIDPKIFSQMKKARKCKNFLAGKINNHD